MTHGKISYVNGKYVPHEKAMVHIEDRGYQFSDGVYEMLAVKKGKLLDSDLHLKRLKRSLKSLYIDWPTSPDSIRVIIKELIRRNKVTNAYVYLQVTRGVAPRNHPFPKDAKPSLTVMFSELQPPPQKDYESGVKVITGPDLRWGRRDIKSISLLANVLAKQEAVKAGVKEMWLIDGNSGNITEGSSTNAYIINKAGEIVTHPANECILGGVTRDKVLRVAKKAGIKVKEKPFKLKDALAAKEAFLTSTTSGVLPVVQVDKKKIGNGKPGEITKKLMKAYSDFMNKR